MRGFATAHFTRGILQPTARVSHNNLLFQDPSPWCVSTTLVNEEPSFLPDIPLYLIMGVSNAQETRA
jgi:hypothetical protein